MSNHALGTSSTLSVGSLSPTRSHTTTSSTPYSSVLAADELGGVNLNVRNQRPPPSSANVVHHLPRVEFDSEEDEFSEDYDGEDEIQVSSARESASGSLFQELEALLGRQIHSDTFSLFGGRRSSLPMASSEHRERTQKVTIGTVRRGSRNLDTQGRVTGAGGSLIFPMSVAETDNDCALSTTGVAVTSPSNKTIISDVAKPMESAGSMDLFGFDEGWNAMQGGITGLNVSDIAVHSSSVASHGTSSQRRPSHLSLIMRRHSSASGGSVMLDPDSFTMAVRGWGGDGYERQRKHWMFRRDAADGRGGHVGKSSGVRMGAARNPVRGITAMKSTSKVVGRASGAECSKHAQWRGMVLNAQEIWNSLLVGRFKVRRIETRPQKPQQRVTIEPLRMPYIGGTKPRHSGAYTSIHKHSKVTAFSIHRHYKPVRPLPTADILARGTMPHMGVSMVSGGRAGSRRNASGTQSGQQHEEQKQLTAIILLAPRYVQVAYTSTNTTKELRSHGLLDESRDRGHIKGREGSKNRTPGRYQKRREQDNDKETARASLQNGAGSSQLGSDEITSTYRDNWQHTYPPPAPASSGRQGDAPRSRPASYSRRDNLPIDSDSETEPKTSRTTHKDAFSTMDATSITQMQFVAEAHGEISKRAFSFSTRAETHTPYNPPWLTLQSRGHQEKRKRRRDMLNSSFKNAGLHQENVFALARLAPELPEKPSSQNAFWRQNTFWCQNVPD